jgi:hypothetical protein
MPHTHIIDDEDALDGGNHSGRTVETPVKVGEAAIVPAEAAAAAPALASRPWYSVFRLFKPLDDKLAQFHNDSNYDYIYLRNLAWATTFPADDWDFAAKTYKGSRDLYDFGSNDHEGGDRTLQNYCRNPDTNPGVTSFWNIGVLKNIVKYFVEYLPYKAQLYSEKKIYQLRQENAKNEEQQKSTSGNSAKIVGLTAVHYLSKGIRRTCRFVTSPISTFNEAWNIHPALGVISAVISAAAMIGLGIVAAPAVVVGGLVTAAAHVGSAVGAAAVAAGHAVAGAVVAATNAVYGAIKGLYNSVRSVTVKSLYNKFTAWLASDKSSGEEPVANNPPIARKSTEDRDLEAEDDENISYEIPKLKSIEARAAQPASAGSAVQPVAVMTKAERAAREQQLAHGGSMGQALNLIPHGVPDAVHHAVVARAANDAASVTASAVPAVQASGSTPITHVPTRIDVRDATAHSPTVTPAPTVTRDDPPPLPLPEAAVTPVAIRAHS